MKVLLVKLAKKKKKNQPDDLIYIENRTSFVKTLEIFFINS